ncbi:hypothetical protein [Arcicella aurantiaca]|nr:hypothetical protein [Arcicella aurantiaca]
MNRSYGTQWLVLAFSPRNEFRGYNMGQAYGFLKNTKIELSNETK